MLSYLSWNYTAPSGPPQSPNVTVLSSQSIEINWLPPLLPEQNGVIIGYIIVVTPLNTGISQQLITSVTNTLLVPNLAPFTTYVCIVAARTAIGRGPFSSVITVQTLEAGK
jgi:receptor-type tyrosine-protein phosphatase Q